MSKTDKLLKQMTHSVAKLSGQGVEIPNYSGVNRFINDGHEQGGELNLPKFKMSTGAVAGHVLTSDADGNGTWQAPPTNWLQKYVWCTWECRYTRDTPSITRTFNVDEYTSEMTNTVAGDVADSNLYIPTMLTGDFDIQVSYKDYNYDTPGSTGAYNGLAFGDTPNWSGAESFGIYRIFDVGAPDNDCYCAISWGATFQYSGATTDTSGKLRITRTGAVVKWYYWNNATSAWVLLATENYSANDMYVYLYQTQTDDGNVPCTSGLTFYDFVINSGTFV